MKTNREKVRREVLLRNMSDESNLGECCGIYKLWKFCFIFCYLFSLFGFGFFVTFTTEYVLNRKQ